MSTPQKSRSRKCGGYNCPSRSGTPDQSNKIGLGGGTFPRTWSRTAPTTDVKQGVGRPTKHPRKVPRTKRPDREFLADEHADNRTKPRLGGRSSAKQEKANAKTLQGRRGKRDSLRREGSKIAARREQGREIRHRRWKKPKHEKWALAASNWGGRKT